MSIKMIEAVLTHSKSKGLARTILLAIANHADDDGHCWPGMERIAKFANCSTRSARRVIHGTLEKSGEVKTSVGGGRHKSNDYQVTLTPGPGYSSETRTSVQETRTSTTLNPDATSSESSVIVREPSAVSPPPVPLKGEVVSDKKLADAHALASKRTAEIEKAVGGFKLAPGRKGAQCPECGRGIVWMCIDGKARCAGCQKVFDVNGKAQ